MHQISVLRYTLVFEIGFMFKNPSQGAGERGFVCREVVQTGLHQIWSVSVKDNHAGLGQSQVKSTTLRGQETHNQFIYMREKVRSD